MQKMREDGSVRPKSRPRVRCARGQIPIAQRDSQSPSRKTSASLASGGKLGRSESRRDTVGGGRNSAEDRAPRVKSFRVVEKAFHQSQVGRLEVCTKEVQNMRSAGGSADPP